GVLRRQRVHVPRTRVSPHAHIIAAASSAGYRFPIADPPRSKVPRVPGALLPAQAAGAMARAGFSRWATYRQAAVAGMFTNTVFGIIKLSVLLAVIDETGGTVAGYDHASPSTYVWVSQGLIAVVYVFGWSELALRVRT